MLSFLKCIFHILHGLRCFIVLPLGSLKGSRLYTLKFLLVRGDWESCDVMMLRPVLFGRDVGMYQF